MRTDSGFQDALRQVLELGDISEAALTNLSDADRDEADLFAQLWPATEACHRLVVVRSLVDLAESNFRVDFDALFWHCLRDEQAGVRQAAIEGLWENESPALVPELLGMLAADESMSVRAEAAVALGRFALMAELEELDRGSWDRICSSLLQVIRNDDEPIEVRRRSIEAISCMTVAGLRGIIDEAYCHPDRLMQLSALFAMGRSADPFWRDIVVGELSDSDPVVRHEAARAAGELEAEESVDALIRMIADPYPEVRSMAVWALGQIGGDRAKRALRDCCKGGDEDLRTAAEEALAELELGSTRLDLLVAGLHEPLVEGNSEEEAQDLDGVSEDG